MLIVITKKNFKKRLTIEWESLSKILWNPSPKLKKLINIEPLVCIKFIILVASLLRYLTYYIRAILISFYN